MNTPDLVAILANQAMKEEKKRSGLRYKKKGKHKKKTSKCRKNIDRLLYETLRRGSTEKSKFNV